MRKFGVCTPQNVREAKILNEQNESTPWFDVMKLELQQLQDCNSCQSAGKNAHVPPGHKQIPVKMVFDVKQLLKRKAKLAAWRDKTSPPHDTAHSGVASL